MTNSYARDAFTYGFDFPRPRSRAERLARLDALATLLDTAFILPGTNVRFGFDAIIGLVPGIGDAITTAISLYIVHEARQLGAPLHVIMRMLANVVVDGFVGAVPVFGDAFDVMWRANRRNVRLLREWLARGDGQASSNPGMNIPNSPNNSTIRTQAKIRHRRPDKACTQRTRAPARISGPRTSHDPGSMIISLSCPGRADWTAILLPLAHERPVRVSSVI